MSLPYEPKHDIEISLTRFVHFSATQDISNASDVSPQIREPPRTFPAPNEWKKQNDEQILLTRELRLMMQVQPFRNPKDFTNWYWERVKESRTRLPRGSAESAQAISLLMRYARRRRDVYTLRRLRPSALAWSRDYLRRVALRPGPVLREHDLLSTQLDNMLFGLAAQQNNWTAMHALASLRSGERWTPFMCRALLRTEGALSMVSNANVPETPPSTLDVGESRTRNALWGMFLDEFGRMIRCSQQKSWSNRSEALAPLPPWITVALMELYARSGRAKQAVTLMNMHLAGQLAARPKASNHEPIVIPGGPPRLITNRETHIPGPVLLNPVLAAFLHNHCHNCALNFFKTMTRTPIKSPGANALPLFDTHFVLQPDNNTLLLVMNAVRDLNPYECGEAQLNLLKKFESTWGVLGESTQTKPLVIDMRPFTKLLQFCEETNNKILARRVLRYQQGAFQRAFRWLESHGHTNGFSQSHRPNEFTILKHWQGILSKLYRRRWIRFSHVRALNSLSKQWTLFLRQTRISKPSRQT